MEGKTIVEMKDIVKAFSGVKALDGVRFDLREGEVMALLGENGAGKSTLMKILSGVYTRDGGEMTLFGKHIEGDLTPKMAADLGIAIIHQELNMCKHLTVAQNIFLGREPTKPGGILDEKKMVELTQAALDKLGITDFGPDVLLDDLAVGKQQMVEITKAIQKNAKVLIMDEPTSALTEKEVVKLFDIINDLKAHGVGIVYISHRLEELAHIVDRVTIMRDSHYITNGNFKDFTMDEIIKNMVGREITEKFPHVETERGEKIFSVSHLKSGRMVKDVSFDVYKGEILGIAGLMGAGRTESLRAIFGADELDSGTVTLKGRALHIKCPMDAIKDGVVLAPEDRKKDGLCTKLSIRHNIALANLDRLCNKLTAIITGKETEMVDTSVTKLKIKLANDDLDAGALSGGNQQKVVVAKWLARNIDVIMFDEPTRGIDVGAKVEIYRLMNELKQQGKAVLFVSSELPEVLGMADRIAVFCDGRVTGELMRKEATQEKIMHYATQFGDKMSNAAA